MMGLFDDIARPVVNVVGGVTRLTARTIATALAIPLTLAEEALEEGCETVDDVREYIRKHAP